MSNETKLKPCPFCGGEANITNTGYGYGSGSFNADYEVGCCNCKIRFRGTSYILMKNGVPVVSVDGYKECVELWNRRADDGTK